LREKMIETLENKSLSDLNYNNINKF
jgi:hypothetical protein